MSPLPDVQFGSEEPLYNIGVVARMTGISMATLRAWERRYNFPEVDRTSGGHRLFSEKDVMRLRWVKARIDEGMQTAQAINALRHQEHNGKSTGAIVSELSSKYPLGAPASPLDVLHERLFDALIRRDIQSADLILSEGLTTIYPDDVILDVIAPTFTRIGEAWENNLASIATEHLATNYLRQRLLMWMLSGPPPRVMNPVVLACAPNEWHEGGLLTLGALLRRRRWPVAYLGQAVPLPDLAGFVREIKPPLVVLIAMMEDSAAELVQWPRWMPEVAQQGQPMIAYAGRIFARQPEWRMRMTGIYLGDTLKSGLEAVESLLQTRI